MTDTIQTQVELSFKDLWGLRNGTFIKMSAALGPLGITYLAPADIFVTYDALPRFNYQNGKDFPILRLFRCSNPHQVHPYELSEETLKAVTQGTPITTPTQLEIEAAKIKREDKLIATLQDRMAADVRALANARERLRLLAPNATT